MSGSLQPLGFLEAIAGYVRNAPSNGSSSADRPIRLATIDPAYSSFAPPYPAGIAPARVTFEGETTVSGKYYPIAYGFIPSPNQRVYLVPIGTTYLIAGAVVTTEAQGFYQDGTITGVEFGDGNYFDTLEGLQLDTDAFIGGDLTVNGIGAQRDVVKPSDTARLNNATVTADPHLTMNFTPGTWKVEFLLLVTGNDGDIQTTWTTTGTVSTNIKSCWGPSPFTVDTGTADETAGRESVPMRLAAHVYATAVPYGLSSTSLFANIWEYGVVTFATAGSLTLNWAQQTLDNVSSTAIRAGSIMSARRVA